MEKGEIDPKKEIVIKKDDKVGGMGVLNYLTSPLKLYFKDLVHLMIILSDNTASNILIHELSLDKINQFIKYIQLKNTELQREFMDLNNSKENFTTCEDVIQILRIIGEPNKLLSTKSREEMLKILSNQQFKHKLPAYNNNYIESDLTFFNKTGEINGIEHDAGILIKDTKRIYISILSSGWSNNWEGQKTIGEIGKRILKYS